MGKERIRAKVRIGRRPVQKCKGETRLQSSEGRLRRTDKGVGNRGDEQRARRSNEPTRLARSENLAEFGVQITEYR